MTFTTKWIALFTASLIALGGCGRGSESRTSTPIDEAPPAAQDPAPITPPVAQPEPTPSAPPIVEPEPAPSTPPIVEPEPAPSAPPAPEPVPTHATKLKARDVRKVMTRVADWALANPERYKSQSWIMAPLYDGLIDTSLMTGDPKYLAAVLRVGKCVAFKSGSRLYHADGHAAGRSWLRIYQMMSEKDRAILEPWVSMFDRIVANPILEEWVFGDTPPEGRKRTDRWIWTDALYMAPPTIVVLAQLTDNKQYLEFMDSEYRFAYDGLYDADERLFYRDARYMEQRTPNGEGVFWSRGNGWVYAGLALILDALPADHPTRDFYLSLFDEMSTALVETQQKDGFWYPSLKDAQHAPTPESSGTALFVLGMAHGIRLGFLDPATYWPTVERGWKAILTAVEKDGAVGRVQPPASWPDLVDPSSRVAYGTGAVLGAASAILRALGEREQADGATLVTEADALVPTTLDLSLKQECVRPQT